MKRLPIALLLVAAAAPALAQPPCPAGPPAPPPALAAWSTRTSLSATAGDAAPRAALTVGRAVDLTLLPAAAVRPVVTPGKAAAADSYGAVVSLMVDRPGRYRVALGTGAWIELAHGGKPVASAGHDHGPACTGIRKMVDFTLTPGRYVVQLTGSPAARTGLLVARVP